MHVIDYRKSKQEHYESAKTNFTNDDVMKDNIEALQLKLPRAPLPFNPALLVPCVSINSLASGCFRGFSEKMPKCTWLCAGISLVRDALQTR